MARFPDQCSGFGPEESPDFRFNAPALPKGGADVYPGASAEPAVSSSSALRSTTADEAPWAGQDNPLEIDAQGGFFDGLRIRAFMPSAGAWSFGIEGMAGVSFFSIPPIAVPLTYGAGARAVLNLASGPRHAWLISPGIDGYYIPASRFHPTTAPQSPDDLFVQDLASALTDIPTRIVLLSPNVDFSWMYQLGRHFDLVAGARVGVATAVNGSDSTGRSLAGLVNPDLGLYIGARF